MILSDHLKLNIINESNSLYSLYPEWLELFNRCKNVTPFLSPDWQIPWWTNFSNHSMLNIIELRIKNHLCGLAPVFINFYSDNNSKEFKFIGTGNSDYLDVILDDEFTTPGMQLIYQYLIDTLKDNDHCYFQGLQDNSPFLSVQAPDELKIDIVKKNICPVIFLPYNDNKNASILEVDQSDKILDRLLSKYFHKYIKRNKRILSESGLLELVTADSVNITAYLNELFILHKSRWALNEQPGVLSDVKVQLFHHQASENLFSHGSLRIYKLLHNNITIAIIYLLMKDRKFYNYLGGFNPDYKKFSPGSILLYEVIGDCIESGCTEFNMLNGEEDYKYRWGAVDKMNYTITIKQK